MSFTHSGTFQPRCTVPRAKAAILVARHRTHSLLWDGRYTRQQSSRVRLFSPRFLRVGQGSGLTLPPKARLSRQKSRTNDERPEFLTHHFHTACYNRKLYSNIKLLGVDAPDSKSSTARCVGSIPTLGTNSISVRAVANARQLGPLKIGQNAFAFSSHRPTSRA